MEICTGQKLKYENKQRTITQKLEQARVKVHVHCTPPFLEICSRQISSMKINKGNNSKIKQVRVKVHVQCTPHLMRSIHQQNFITIASIVLEI